MAQDYGGLRPICSLFTYSRIVSTLALFLALGGGAYAVTALDPKSVGTKHLKRGAVTSGKVEDGSLLGKDFKTGQLPAGSQGPAGQPGGKGDKGDPGTARAYAWVAGGCGVQTPPVCSFHNSKGITSVTRPVMGQYCITAPGLSGRDLPVFAAIDYGSVAHPEGNYTASVRTSGDECPNATDFAVRTEFINPATATAAETNVAAFTVLIP
ncbi:MAG TPA: hypothetical protein VD790_05030 [Thermoleophilaceae bacterium]|nr:hypothetical protein [Thermoleophilaceae bacterium]